MGNKKKNFVAPPAIAAITAPSLATDSLPIVEVGNSVIYNGDSVDFSPWLHLGIDDWIWTCVNQLRAFRSGNTQAQSSIVTYGRQSLPKFFQFLLDCKVPPTPRELQAHHVRQFLGWLKSSEMSPTSRRQTYVGVKSVLAALHRRNAIDIPPDSFPKKPFSGTINGLHAEKALSIPERAHLATAIRNDLIKLHRREFFGSATDVLTVYILALALRTGLNTTPMLEMRRNALGPHPFMPNMRILQSFKRRGNSTNHKALRQSLGVTTPTSIPMDGVALFDKVIELTAGLAAQKSPYSDRLWLYSKSSHDKTGLVNKEIYSLSAKDLATGIKKLVKRHDLKGDDGTRLRLNMSRLRKTMENRLWRLSNGDLFSVALLMGHQPRVADTTYLQVTPDMKRNATIVGEALPAMYREGTAKVTIERTPVGGCKDGLYGDKAPKNGVNSCGDFMSCLDCRSYAIIGSPEDLHRLFSFYWFLDNERNRIKSIEWREQFARMKSQIDKFTEINFDPNLVSEAKELAHREPHPFWKNYVAYAISGRN